MDISCCPGHSSCTQVITGEFGRQCCNTGFPGVLGGPKGDGGRILWQVVLESAQLICEVDEMENFLLMGLVKFCKYPKPALCFPRMASSVADNLTSALAGLQPTMNISVTGSFPEDCFYTVFLTDFVLIQP